MLTTAVGVEGIYRAVVDADEEHVIVHNRIADDGARVRKAEGPAQFEGVQIFTGDASAGLARIGGTVAPSFPAGTFRRQHRWLRAGGGEGQ
jgi:hypothetical protein